jgi:ABC-2 type transport system ATP-binding protein
MQSLISITELSKTYASGFEALKNINLDIKKGEILALLGPNGAGKTTLISIICGIVNPTSGSVRVDGHDIITEFRKTRAMIGLVPQELSTEVFSTVFSTLSFSRGLFGKKKDPRYIEKILRSLSLWDKKDSPINELSGGMKRRVLIGKALAHEPDILFLDEPTAGVDVELRKDMWTLIRQLQAQGVTIILTTHYIEEAEEIADRVGIINHGEIIVIEETSELMRKLGKKQLILELPARLESLPAEFDDYDLKISADGMQLIYTYHIHMDRTGITSLLSKLSDKEIRFRDLKTKQSSLEDIFVTLVGKEKP